MSLSLEGSSPGRIEVMKQGGSDRCHVAVRVSDFEAAVAALQAQGVALEEPRVNAEMKTIFLRELDPAGHRVQLIWRR